MALPFAWPTGPILALGWYRRWQGWTPDEFVVAATIAAMPSLLLARSLRGPDPDGPLRRLLDSAVTTLSMLARMLVLVYAAIMATCPTEARA